MAKFILHGRIVGEPERRALPTGTEIVEITVEERIQTPAKEIVGNFKISFIGKVANAIPTSHNVNGEMAIIMGNVKSREYNGKMYYDLSGESFTLVSNEALHDKPSPVDVEVEPSGSVIKDDDLPF